MVAIKEISDDNENVKTFLLNGNDDGSNLEDLAFLSPTRKQELKDVLNNGGKILREVVLVGNFLKNAPKTSIEEYPLDKMVSTLINSNNKDLANEALKNLLEIGAGGMPQFLKGYPLHHAITTKNILLIQMLNHDPLFRLALLKEKNYLYSRADDVPNISVQHITALLSNGDMRNNLTRETLEQFLTIKNLVDSQDTAEGEDSTAAGEKIVSFELSNKSHDVRKMLTNVSAEEKIALKKIVTLLTKFLINGENLDNIVTSSISLANKDPRSLQTLLDIGMGNHPEFLKQQPLHSALKDGKINIISMLKDNPLFCKAIQEESNLKASRVYSAFPEVYKAMLTDDLEKLQNLSPSELFKTKNYKILPLQFVHEWKNSNKFLATLENKYKEAMPGKLLECFQEELKYAKEFDKNLQDNLINKVGNILGYVYINEKDKEQCKNVAGSMVREAARVAGLPSTDWKSSLMDRLKDIIKNFLSNLGFFNSEMQKFAQIQMKDEELMSGLKKIKVENDKNKPTSTFQKDLLRKNNQPSEARSRPYL